MVDASSADATCATHAAQNRVVRKIVKMDDVAFGATERWHRFAPEKSRTDWTQ